jgi:heat shock protein HslJ
VVQARRRFVAVWLTLAVVALSACTGRPPAQGHPASAAPPATVHSDPLALVGQWFLDADGETPGSAVAFGEQLTLFLSCGVLDGEWKADGQQSLFVASSSAGDSTCFADGSRHPLPWLDAAVAFRVDGPNRRLLDSDGRTVALLRPGARPTVGPNRSKSFYETPPTVTPAMTLAAQDPAALPAAAAPIAADQLAHEWLPNEVPATSRARLTFGDDGRWNGSDGCNGQGGRFVLGRDGLLLATAGASTAIGCRGAPVGAWVAQVSRAGLVSGQLVLYDRDGKTLGRLHRGGGSAGVSASPPPKVAGRRPPRSCADFLSAHAANCRSLPATAWPLVCGSSPTSRTPRSPSTYPHPGWVRTTSSATWQ